MDFKLEIKPCPSITVDDVNFSPPIIPIAEEDAENAGDLTRARLMATMIFPNTLQSRERQKCAAIIYAYNLSKKSRSERIYLDKNTLLTLIGEPTMDIGTMTKLANDAQTKGHVSGITLFLIHELYLANSLSIIDIEPSINMAINFIEDMVAKEQKYQRKKKRKLPQSHPNLEAYWKEYKKVSHLWLAAYLLEQSQKEEGTCCHKGRMPFLTLSDTTNIRKLFKIAEQYRLFGESFRYRRANKNTQGTFFVQDEAWRPSSNLDLTGITITDEKKLYAGLSSLIASWKQRGK